MIGLALLTLVPGELGGSETAARSLLQQLAATGTLPYRVYLPPVAPDGSEGLPSEIVGEYREARTIPERLLAMGLAAARPGSLRRRLQEADVVHYPLTIRIPPTKAPSVVTLHDTQHLDLPALFSRGERLFRVFAYHRSARSASRVIVPSAFVRDRAIASLGLDPSRIRVIHHGIDHTRFVPGTVEREPFVLYPARRWLHKNHDRLLEAWTIVRRTRPDLRLVFTGGGHPPESPDGVDVRGHISGDELVSLYQRATAVVFPSLYEGFGQPPLEAMACGAPVASSNAASLPEVCGDAALLFDPNDPQAIAQAILDVVAAPDAWRTRGFARAAAFTWASSAQAHEAVYRELL